MTKSLTEQWKDMTLVDGDYYIRVVPHLLGKEIIVPRYCSGGYCEGYKDNEVKEVLSPVPTYEEYLGLLSDQLAKNEAEEINAELEAQLKEANEVIADLSEYPPINTSTRELSFALNRYNAKNYLEKWGVK